MVRSVRRRGLPCRGPWRFEMANSLALLSWAGPDPDPEPYEDAPNPPPIEDVRPTPCSWGNGGHGEPIANVADSCALVGSRTIGPDPDPDPEPYPSPALPDKSSGIGVLAHSLKSDRKG